MRYILCNLLQKKKIYEVGRELKKTNLTGLKEHFSINLSYVIEKNILATCYIGTELSSPYPFDQFNYGNLN